VTVESGGHRYPNDDGTSDCLNGCGAWMGPYRSGAPDGIDPHGACPKGESMFAPPDENKRLAGPLGTQEDPPRESAPPGAIAGEPPAQKVYVIDADRHPGNKRRVRASSMREALQKWASDVSVRLDDDRVQIVTLDVDNTKEIL
jgi:hypothetical protein